MGFTRTGSLLLLQAAVSIFLSEAAASPCRPACSPDDPLLTLINSQDDVIPFCRDFLSLPVSTVEVTVTPTVVASVTETSYVTQITTVVDGTVTVTVPATTTTVAPAKRDIAEPLVAFPDWLPTGYRPARVSSACACLSIQPSVTTAAATAEAATLTETATLAQTTVTTAHTVATVTEVAKPVPVLVKRTIKIEVLRKDTQAVVGYLYNSNGPAVSSTVAGAFSFPLSSDLTTSSAVRISVDGITQVLGFSKPSSVALENYYGSMTNVDPTPPGSTPVKMSSNAIDFESDIWTVNTQTKSIGWQWVSGNGAVITNVALWRVGGRLYPVGSQAAFNTAFASVSAAAKMEVILRYTVVSEQ
ncbi:hypothetical protein B0H63DRAFT_560280 [Podospora didyma]|uniref:Secreted protein n=1 Tax=Podospora didyma TaxID=330526 RepID=A0AAE0TZY6_9PEZI|nr:hypothetical protein B0H63DRAFT_560280 [Podospora didyma]